MADVTLLTTHDPRVIARFAGTTAWTIVGSPRTLTIDVDQAELDAAVSEYEANGFSLAYIQGASKHEIDSIAERVRQKYITVGDGQAMVYVDKGNEAADYKAAGYPAGSGSPPTLTNYPFIQAEVDATGKTNQVATDDILTERSNWVAKASSIEKERLGGKKAVDDAADVLAASDAREAAITALKAL